MKSVCVYAIGLVLCILLLSALPLEGEGAIYDNVIRLHILAASDSEEDQEDKLAVRDAILGEYGPLLQCESEADAAARVEELMPAIKELAEKTLAERGTPARVTVTFTDEGYPTRTYGGLIFPSGTYHSLRILIGEGVGKNWWCVLFPPLCVGAATEEVPITPPADAPAGVEEGAWHLVSRSGEYESRFRFLEMLSAYGDTRVS